MVAKSAPPSRAHRYYRERCRSTTVVIELKAGMARPEVFTQLLAYVGVMAGEEQRPPWGILIAEDFHPRVVFGARAVPSIQLWRYRFKFTFESVTQPCTPSHQGTEPTPYPARLMPGHDAHLRSPGIRL